MQGVCCPVKMVELSYNVLCSSTQTWRIESAWHYETLTARYKLTLRQSTDELHIQTTNSTYFFNWW